METEKKLNDNETIVSSTNMRGIITYANKEFSQISGYTKKELYGNPHNLVRHDDMPKCIFKLVWQALLKKEPVVAYVKNITKDKSQYYWVKAMIYPIVKNNEIVQLTSYRTKASSYAIAQCEVLYSLLTNYEKTNDVNASALYFDEYLKKRKLTYSIFINKLNNKEQINNEKLLSMNLDEYKMDIILFKSIIESLVTQGEENVPVADSKSCGFGKHLTTLIGEDFTHDERYIEVHRLHDKIHDDMISYTNVQIENRKRILVDVDKDIEKLFDVLGELVSYYK